MSILTVEGLSKSYGDKVLFDKLSFTIESKQRIGLIGVNGTGKSTLLKAIAGLEQTESGDIRRANQFRIEYLPQEPDFGEDGTVLDYIYQGEAPMMRALREYEQALRELERDPGHEGAQRQFAAMQQRMEDQHAWEALTAAQAILTKLGVSLYDQTVSRLSGGQRKRVALARALIQPADLLILDEPTNHLDHDVIEWLEAYLPQVNPTLLMVTHDRYFLNRVATRILELDQGKLYSYDGNYEIFLEKKAEREEQALLAESKRRNLLRRELAWLRRGAKARTTKQKARVQRAEELRDAPVRAASERLEMALGANRLGKKVLELKGASKSYGGRTLFADLDYLVVPGERLGIIGPNGSGKTTLLGLLAGRIQPDAGAVETGSTVKIGYYTQEQPMPAASELRVIEYIRETAEVVRTADGTVIAAEQMLERFLFPRQQQWTFVSKLSGGERRRLFLLRVLMEEPNVLFLDEPTNDLDTETLSVLEDYLEQFPGVVVTVSHDRYFLDRVVDHLLVFQGDGAIRRFEGSYSDYLELRVKERAEERQASAIARPDAQQSDRGTERKERPRKLSFKEQREWEQIEGRIAELERRNGGLLADIEQAGSDSSRVQELFAEQQQVEQELEQAVERWSELSMLMEELGGQ